MTETDAQKYVRWNQMTRHQLIVAHMTLVRGMTEVSETLAKALDTTTSFGAVQLADMAARKLRGEPI